jgi:hypothetical protein
LKLKASQAQLGESKAQLGESKAQLGESKAQLALEQKKSSEKDIQLQAVGKHRHVAYSCA